MDVSCPILVPVLHGIRALWIYHKVREREEHAGVRSEYRVPLLLFLTDVSSCPECSAHPEPRFLPRERRGPLR